MASENYHSSLNYKDGMILKNGKFSKKYPHVPGIDFAGTVSDSKNSLKVTRLF